MPPSSKHCIQKASLTQVHAIGSTRWRDAAIRWLHLDISFMHRLNYPVRCLCPCARARVCVCVCLLQSTSCSSLVQCINFSQLPVVACLFAWPQEHSIWWSARLLPSVFLPPTISRSDAREQATLHRALLCPRRLRWQCVTCTLERRHLSLFGYAEACLPLPPRYFNRRCHSPTPLWSTFRLWVLFRSFSASWLWWRLAPPRFKPCFQV